MAILIFLLYSRVYYFVTRSSQLTIANITPIETTQTERKTVHATHMGQAL